MMAEKNDKIIAKEYNVEAIKFILENAKSVFETERSIVKNNMYINLARFNQSLNNKTISGIENVWIIEERPYNIEKMEITFLIKGDFDNINFDKVVEILKFDEIAIFAFHDFDNEFFIDIDEVDNQIIEDILHQKIYKLY